MLAVDEDRRMAWTPGDRTSVLAGRTARRRVNLLLALAVLPVLIAGCASGDEETVTPKAPPSQTGGTVTTDLTIVSDDGNGKTETWQLTCEPAGGTHPDPAAACAALEAKGKTALPPVPKDTMCTQQFGGPQTAKITGTWKGEPVDASFSRTNGCEISRWTAMKGLLPDAGGTAAK
jgi:hypothetical protein